MLRDGQRVVYSGPGSTGATPGDEGMVVEAQSTYAHVKWAHGGMSLESVADLSAVGSSSDLLVEASLDDSLDVGLEVYAAEVVDVAQEGPQGLLSRMASSGHLAAFSEYADEALALVANRIRHDPSFVTVTATLSDEEGEDLIRTASVVLIRDAFLASEE